jgi:hypothetical protein
METMTEAAAGAAANEAVAVVADAPAQITASAAGATSANKPDLDADLRAVWDKNHPNRWSDGVFASRDPDNSRKELEGTDAADTPGSETRPDEAATNEFAQTEGAVAYTIAPPMSWSAEMKAKWAVLPADVQTYVAKRDKETHEAITRAGQQTKVLGQMVEAYEPLGRLISAYRDDFARRGIPAVQGIAALLDAQRRLDANPLGTLVQIGLTYGIDLRPHLQAAGAAPQSRHIAPSPQPSPSDNEVVRSLHDRLGLHERWIVAQEQAREDAYDAEVRRTVQDFANGRPHFDEVRPLMAALLDSGQASDLAEAYDMAVNAKPDIRRHIQADQRKVEEERRIADARSKAEQARRSASINVKSVPTRANPRTMDDTLTEIARRRYG